jgi:hypothetical protein
MVGTVTQCPNLGECTRIGRILGPAILNIQHVGNGRTEFEEIEQLPQTNHRTCQRRVESGGRLVFQHNVYHSEQLLPQVGRMVIVRYHLADISTISVYQQSADQDVFLGHASIVQTPYQVR